MSKIEELLSEGRSTAYRFTESNIWESFLNICECRFWAFRCAACRRDIRTSDFSPQARDLNRSHGFRSSASSLAGAIGFHKPC
jgi:hypothetical protein